MKSLDMLDQPYQHNASINLFPTGSGLNFSYDLIEKNSWVGVYRNVDFSKLPEFDNIMFQFHGHGAPNTLEFILYQDDGAAFKYKRNGATNTRSNAYVYLYPWQITYLRGGALKRSSTDPVDFSKVKGMEFAISNWPNRDDKPGKGFVVISEIKGEKVQPWLEWPITIATAPSLITGIFSVITLIIGLIGGYLIGRLMPKS